MVSFDRKSSLKALFLLTLFVQLSGCNCFKWFWSGAEPEKVTTPESEYGECDFAQASSTGGAVGAGYYNTNGNQGQNTGYGYDGSSYVNVAAPSYPNVLYNPNDLVASHPTLPVGSYASVTNSNNGKSVTVRIVENAPTVVGRIMTLSSTAFLQIADLDQAVIPCFASMT